MRVYTYCGRAKYLGITQVKPILCLLIYVLLFYLRSIPTNNSETKWNAIALYYYSHGCPTA